MDRPSSEMTLNEITSRWPATLEVLGRYGLDTCCGGARPLREAAPEHGVDPEELVRKLNEVVGRGVVSAG